AVDDRADRGEPAGVVGPADAHVLGGEHAVPAGEVVAGVVVQGADHRELVRYPRLPGEQLGDVEARHPGSDRLPDAAVLRRGLRLHVVQVHVARPAVQPYQDDRRVLLRGRGFAGAQKLWQADLGQAGHAEREEATPVHAVAVAAGASELETK